MSFRPASIAAIAAVTAPLLLLASGAEAHAHLVMAAPSANAAVAAPSAVRLRFSERLAPRFSGADLMQSDGQAVASRAKVSGKAVQLSPTTRLAPGGYMVMWHVVSSDGHKMKGQYNFTVR